MLWGWTENVFHENKKRPILGPPPWGCLSSKRSWRDHIVGIVKGSWVFPMKMASRQDILISGTEERNWGLFVYLRWESVPGDSGRLLTHHCPSAHSDGDVQRGNIHSDWLASALPGKRGFCNTNGVSKREIESWCVQWSIGPEITDLGRNPAPSLNGYDLKQLLGFLA